MTLAEVLAPLTVAEFQSGHLGLAPLHLEGNAARFAALVPHEAAAAVAVQLLARGIEYAVEAPVHIDHGAASLPATAARLHQDALVLQVEGCSRLALWDRSLPQPEHAPRVLALAAGHVAYVPGGWWVADENAASPGSRLAFTIELPTGRALLAWLFKQLDGNESFAAPIPRFAPPAAQADYVTQFRRSIAGACRTPGLVALLGWYANNAASPRPMLPGSRREASAEHDVIDYLVARPLHPWRADAETLTFKFNGKDLWFPLDAAQLLTFLDEHAPVPVATFYQAFADEFDREELGDFLQRLADEGMLAFLPAQTA